MGTDDILDTLKVHTHTSTSTRVFRVFCYADDGQVGDSREIRRLFNVTGLCRVCSWGIFHAVTEVTVLSENYWYN